jgi:hypothetical protein
MMMAAWPRSVPCDVVVTKSDPLVTVRCPACHHVAMSEPQPQPGIPQRLQIEIGEREQVGTFADFCQLWHTDAVFVLDFAALQSAPEVRQDDTGNSYMHLSARVVSRVRIGPDQMFELMKAMNEQLGKWEAAKNPQTSGSSDDV